MTQYTRRCRAAGSVSSMPRPELLEAFRSLGAVPITAKMLDEAGVAHWRQRIRDARETDELRGPSERANYDLAWLNIKNEYLAAKASL